MARRVIDLSQPLLKELSAPSPLPTVQIPPSPAARGCRAESSQFLRRRDHHHVESRRDHVDALSHSIRRRGAEDRRHAARHLLRRGRMRRRPPVPGAGHEVTVAELEQALADGGLRSARATSSCSAPITTTRHGGRAGLPRRLLGVAAECVHWMADRGVKIFGIERNHRPRLPDRRLSEPPRLRRARASSHYENLNNLKDVINRRFEFYGFPWAPCPPPGSPGSTAVESCPRPNRR